MSMIGQLDVVVLDTADYRGLAAFYAELAGWEQTYADDDWISLRANDGWKVGFQLAPDHRPPHWPGMRYPRMIMRREKEAEAGLVECTARPLGAHFQPRPQRLEHVRRSAFRGEAAVAVLDHWEPAGCGDQASGGRHID